jgi:hypothetical protein
VDRGRWEADEEGGGTTAEVGRETTRDDEEEEDDEEEDEEEVADRRVGVVVIEGAFETVVDGATDAVVDEDVSFKSFIIRSRSSSEFAIIDTSCTMHPLSWRENE